VFKGKRVSVVMPAYNEEESIPEVVKSFLSNKYVDEVVVVDNNSKDNTAKLAKDAGARVVEEERQGYGYACRRALGSADGDYIILTESDGTFEARDVKKFLAYSEDFDLVMGTRTSKELVWKGANMGLFLKWGNWGLGKIMEILYNGPSLTDVGCTYRSIKKDALNKIQDKFTVGGSHFLPEMTLLAIKENVRILEIPINYKPRCGTSKITGKSKWVAFRLGLRMLWTIITFR